MATAGGSCNHCGDVGTEVGYAPEVATTIGVLSDSHDALDRLQRARELLSSRGVELSIHCGDICTPDAVRALEGLQVHWVFGNCDFDQTGLRRVMSRVGHTCHTRSGRLKIEGRQIAFTHGDRPQLVRTLVAERPNLILVGHSHVRGERLVDGVRILNPGALHRANPTGFALVRLPEISVEWVELPG